MEKLQERIINQSKYWWMSVIIGVLSFGLGIWAISAPVELLVTLSLVFIISFIFSGTMGFIYAIAYRKQIENWGWSLVSAIIDIIIAVILIYNIPFASIILMIFLLGFWLLLHSLTSFGLSFTMKGNKQDGWIWILMMAIINLILAVLVISNMGLAVNVIVIMAAIGFMTNGIIRFFYGWKLRRIRKEFKN